MARHITVGIDGSRGSDAALEWAIAEALDTDSPLEIVHAVQAPPGDSIYQRSAIEHRLAVDLRKYSQDLLASAEERVREIAPRLNRWTRTEIGSPMAVLAGASRDADAVVVGRRGTGALDGILGSVSSRLALHAHCPVIVVPHRAGFVTAGPVVVGVDDSPISKRALRYALERATRRRTSVRVVSAYTPPSVTIPLTPAAIEDFERSEAADAAASVKRQVAAARTQHTRDVEVEIVVALGMPAEIIVDHSDDAQLIVVGSHGRGVLRRMLLGSVSHRLLHDTSQPVVVIGPEPDDTGPDGSEGDGTMITAAGRSEIESADEPSQR